MEKKRIETIESVLWDDDYFTGLSPEMVVKDTKLEGKLEGYSMTVIKMPHKDSNKLAKYAVVVCHDNAVVGTYSWFEVTYTDRNDRDIDIINLLPGWLDCAADKSLVINNEPIVAFVEQIWLDEGYSPALLNEMKDCFTGTCNAKMAFAAPLEDGEDLNITNLGFNPTGNADIYAITL